MRLEFWFPTPIWSCNLDYDTNKILDYALNLFSVDDGRDATNVGGWQSNDLYYENDSPIKDFLDIINIKLTECIFEYNYEISGIELGNFWFNINGHGNYNLTHTHPGSFLSGVYYIKVPEDCGVITFDNDSKSNFILQSYRTTGDSVLSHSQCKYPPHEGMLIIFPSWLPHSVTANNSHESRISFSFNSRILK